MSTKHFSSPPSLAPGLSFSSPSSSVSYSGLPLILGTSSKNPHLLHFHCYFRRDPFLIHRLNQAAGSVLELESPPFRHHRKKKEDS